MPFMLLQRVLASGCGSLSAMIGVGQWPAFVARSFYCPSRHVMVVFHSHNYTVTPTPPLVAILSLPPVTRRGLDIFPPAFL